ncbi:MAG: hypothetical protein ACKORM_08330 [Solirubrobacterales bacterium]
MTGQVTPPVNCTSPTTATIGAPVRSLITSWEGNERAQGQRERALRLVNREFTRRVSERGGDNVPKYRNGRGAIAPYSIGDAWCAAFVTWAWGKAGFDAFQGASYLQTAHGGDTVAIQVRDLSTWARRNGYWTYRATPGDLISYEGESHIGMVMQVDRPAGLSSCMTLGVWLSPW